MPESTEDIQDIDQLIAEADTLVAELASVTTAMVQSTSDEGPSIESREWVPPVESEVSGPESPDDTTADPDEPVTDSVETPSAGSTDEADAELVEQVADEPTDDAPATSTNETAHAGGQESDQVEEVASQADASDAANRPALIASQSTSNDAKDDSEVDPTSGRSNESAPDPTSDSDSDLVTESASQGSSESAQAAPQVSTGPESASKHNDESQPSIDQPVQAHTASSAESIDPIESSEAGQAVRLDDPPPDPPETVSQDEPETTSHDAQEPICEIESDESEHEPSGDILVDDAPLAAQSEKHELLADACAGPIEDTAEASERVRSLDDELAKLADEMIEGEEDDADAGVLMNAANEDDEGSPDDEEPDQANRRHASQREDASAHSNAKGQADAPDTPDASNPEQADSPKARQPAASQTAAIKGRIWFCTKIAARRTVEIARERGPVIAAQIEPIARITCERASKPLDKKKPIVRKTMGWVAVSTAVYASLVLFYVAFIRKPPMIEPDQPGTTLIDDTGRPIASHPDGN